MNGNIFSAIKAQVKIMQQQFLTVRSRTDCADGGFSIGSDGAGQFLPACHFFFLQCMCSTPAFPPNDANEEGHYSCNLMIYYCLNVVIWLLNLSNGGGRGRPVGTTATAPPIPPKNSYSHLSFILNELLSIYIAIENAYFWYLKHVYYIFRVCTMKFLVQCSL